MKLNKQRLLESFKQDYLQILVDIFKVDADKRINSEMIDALMKAREISLKDILNEMSVQSLKDGCKYYSIKSKSHLKAELVRSLLSESIHSPRWPIIKQEVPFRKHPQTGKLKPVAQRYTPFRAPTGAPEVTPEAVLNAESKVAPNAESNMALLIRVPFNNHGWAGQCNVPDPDDDSLWYCRDERVNTGYKQGKDGYCVAECTDRKLCSDFFYIPGSGKRKVIKGAEPGNKAFFVFPEKGSPQTYVLWGASIIQKVEGAKIYLQPFTPLQEKLWVRDLAASDLVGNRWGSRPVRAIGEEKIQELEHLIDSHKDFTLDETEDDYQGDKEGKQRLGLHLYRERSSRLRDKFKRSLKSKECSICGFDFESTYGPIGKDFIEVHHKIPLSQLKPGTKVSLEDLDAICSNCHRMLHRKKSLDLTSEDLRRIIH